MIDMAVTIGGGGGFRENEALVPLVDGDIVAYQAASITDGRCYTVRGANFKYKTEAQKYAQEEGISSEEIVLTFYPDPPSIAIGIVNQIMAGIQLDFLTEGVSEVKTFLSDDVGNFRTSYLPYYKIGRKKASVILEHFGGNIERLCQCLGTTPATFEKRLNDPNDGRRPANLAACKEHLRKRFSAFSEENLEADDLLGISMSQEERGVICSIDKDLNNIPGLHYNFSTKEKYFVTEAGALVNFYRQCLTGDTTDTVPGVKGIGWGTAKKLIPDSVFEYLTEAEIWKMIKEKWASGNNLSPLQAAHESLSSARCLHILTERGSHFQPPIRRRKR